jgi:hypothetical protein
LAGEWGDKRDGEKEEKKKTKQLQNETIKATRYGGKENEDLRQ